MSVGRPVSMVRGAVIARVRPAEGGVLDELFVDGRSVLARTPWADGVAPVTEPALTEDTWVAAWRGGWQLCFPNSGQPDPGAATLEGFHGAASQTPWLVIDRTDEQVALRWEDALGLRADRTWHLTDDGVTARTSVLNEGSATRRIAIAEHLVLGGEVVSPVLAGSALTLEVPDDTALAPLDYSGRPLGDPVPWPGDPAERWAVIDATTPARLAGLVGLDREAGSEYRVTARGPHVVATVSWSGLPYALLWEELAQTPEAPWNGAIVAVGIEPTSTPHGAGTGAGHGIVAIGPNERMSWWTALSVAWTPA